MNERTKELAEQAGKTYAESFRWEYTSDIDKDIFEKFAELVRADEREACAKVCEQLGMATNGINERNHECAAAIRARGDK